jgi:hypothetical protein
MGIKIPTEFFGLFSVDNLKAEYHNKYITVGGDPHYIGNRATNSTGENENEFDYLGSLDSLFDFMQ